MSISWIGSPNFTAGRGGNKVTLIVVHHMAGTLSATDQVFQDTKRNTSAHYGIGRNGGIHQYVNEADTAFHAGNYPINQRSIGIEHEDLNRDEYTDLEYQTSAQLIREMCKRYNLPISRETVRPHNEFSATACPGTLDIDRLINLAKGEQDMLSVNRNIAIDLGVGILGRSIADAQQEDYLKSVIGQPVDVVIRTLINSKEAQDFRAAAHAPKTGKPLSDYTLDELFKAAVAKAK